MNSSGTEVRLRINFSEPPTIVPPSTEPCKPFPGSTRKSFTSVSATFSPAYSTMAFPRGCSLRCSSAAAYFKSVSSEIPSAGRRSVTLGRPSVMVPVLSRAMILILPAFSSDSEVLNRMPFRAPIPFPTMMATGVARPKAQGQEITRTVMACSSAWDTAAPCSIQRAKTRTAMPITAGTKMPETLSAIRAIGAFVPAASLTNRIIWAKVVSSPTRAARHRR